MTQPVPQRLAACLLAGLLAAGMLVTPAVTRSTPAAAAETTPLSVSIHSLTPSAIPDRGRITVTGQVTNNSESTWTGLNVYLLTSAAPFETQEQLEIAADTDPTVEIGQRLTAPGLFDPVGDLPPGSSTSYQLSVPRRALEISGQPGVYWLGVHVLGASEDGRDVVADGRARSFVPLMERGGPTTTMSLVVPMKGTVRRNPDGALANLEAWQSTLSPEGRLGRLLQLTGTAGTTPLTWVVDPAVLDAAAGTARDNPGRSIRPTDEESGAAEPTDQPGSTGASPAPGSTEAPQDTGTPDPAETEPGETGEDPEEGTDEPEQELSAHAQEAGRWLQTFRSQTTRHRVLAVPYGDADVSAMMRRDFEELYSRATDLSIETIEGLGIEGTPVVAPATGYLPSRVLRLLDGETPLLLSDQAAPGATSPVIRTDPGHQIVLTDTAAGSGGPGPTPAYSALAVRQRMLSEAALHALSGEADEPLVVSTPQQWDPGADWRAADFFGGLDVPWLRLVDVPAVVSRADALQPEETVYDDRLRYPRRERRAEVPLANLLAAQELVGKGGALAGLLARNDTIDSTLAKSALLATSFRARTRPRVTAARVRATTAEVRGLLGQIEIEGPSFVTMSSEQGPIVVTVINNLDQPVTVGITAETAGDELVIPPPDPVALGPGQRASVRLNATSKETGVHPVQLRPTTAEGVPLGQSIRFNVRSSQVGVVIWAIMGLGAAILVVTSAIRITRRVRRRQATPGPVLQGADQ